MYLKKISHCSGGAVTLTLYANVTYAEAVPRLESPKVVIWFRFSTILAIFPYCPKYSGLFSCSSYAIFGGSPTAYTRLRRITLMLESCVLSLGMSIWPDVLPPANPSTSDDIPLEYSCRCRSLSRFAAASFSLFALSTSSTSTALNSCGSSP
jgi:hypothetical protein